MTKLFSGPLKKLVLRVLCATAGLSSSAFARVMAFTAGQAGSGTLLQRAIRMSRYKMVCLLQLSSAMLVCFFAGAFISATAVMADPPNDAELGKLLETMRAVDKMGVGHTAAAAAWPRLADCNARQLPAILAGMDAANPLAANWIRTAAEKIVARELAAKNESPKSPLPCAELEQFVFDTAHAPKARRLAYEWLLSQDPTARERIIPKMLDDADIDMRRDAVANLMVQAEKTTDQKDAVKTYRRALMSARDEDQVRKIVARLKKLDVEVDLARTFGFIVDWKAAGPFDNSKGAGFAAVYGPETSADFSDAEKWKGKHGAVKVVDVAGKGDRGEVDFNDVIGEEKEVVAYATRRFLSDTQRPIQLRLTTHNALKVWLNGRLIAEYETYHSGGQFDQYVCDGDLQKGVNTILVKICQNQQDQDWAKAWGFSLRVCDKLGGAVLASDRK